MPNEQPVKAFSNNKSQSTVVLSPLSHHQQNSIKHELSTPLIKASTSKQTIKMF